MGCSPCFNGLREDFKKINQHGQIKPIERPKKTRIKNGQIVPVDLIYIKTDQGQDEQPNPSLIILQGQNLQSKNENENAEEKSQTLEIILEQQSKKEQKSSCKLLNEKIEQKPSKQNKAQKNSQNDKKKYHKKQEIQSQDITQKQMILKRKSFKDLQKSNSHSRKRENVVLRHYQRQAFYKGKILEMQQRNLQYCALQCFYQTKHLDQQLNKKQRNFSDNSQFTTYYKNMCEKLSFLKNAFDPTKIKRIIQKYNGRFIGNRQQDSGQIVNTILNIFQEETNKVKDIKINIINKPQQKTDESLFRQYVRKHRAVTNSIIDVTFTGYYKTLYKCQCQQQKRLFEKFTIVYLPLINKKNKYLSKLSDCILEFYQEQCLDWECSKCDKQTPHKKTMKIYKANKTIIFCLKRFNQDNTKIKTDITIPLKLNLNDYYKDHQVSENEKKHVLYAAIIHLGQYYSGHYIAYCYDYRVKCWAQYNDSSVSFPDQNQVKQIIKRAYLLFYRLQSPEEYEQQMK